MYFFNRIPFIIKTYFSPIACVSNGIQKTRINMKVKNFMFFLLLKAYSFIQELLFLKKYPYLLTYNMLEYFCFYFYYSPLIWFGQILVSEFTLPNYSLFHLSTPLLNLVFNSKSLFYYLNVSCIFLKEKLLYWSLNIQSKHRTSWEKYYFKCVGYIN